MRTLQVQLMLWLTLAAALLSAAWLVWIEHSQT
jgi:hypothetical protein